MSGTKAVHVRIEGRVQGVWYRGWTVEEARRRKLKGWVRNRSDGSVEATFVGSAAVVDEMVEACWQGPSAARVSSVSSRSIEEVPEQTGFLSLATES